VKLQADSFVPCDCKLEDENSIVESASTVHCVVLDGEFPNPTRQKICICSTFFATTSRSALGFKKIGIVGGGIQLGPLDTAVTNRPIVPAPGVYDDGEIGGMMMGKGN
jgi:hypothetical protein